MSKFNWPKIKKAYESTTSKELPVRELAKRFKIRAHTTIVRKAKKEQWVRKGDTFPSPKKCTKKSTRQNKKAPNPVGAPKIEINFDTLEKLCQIQATEAEIAGVMGVGITTIVARIKERYGLNFQEYFKNASAGGLVSLRRRQFKAALDGSVPLMIWLGKQHLGQKDQHVQENHNFDIVVKDE